MLRSFLAAGVVAGGLFALSVPHPVSAAPSGLGTAVDKPDHAAEQVRRGGGRGGFGGHRGFRSGGVHRGFRSYGHRGFGPRRHFRGGVWRGGRHWGYRRHRGRYFYGGLPFIYGGGYYSGCGYYWRMYRITGRWYWYRRWQACRW